MKARLMILTVAVMLGIGAVAARACPMCKDSISDTAGSGNVDGRGMQDGLPGGFNTSVYIMLAAFLGTSGLIGVVITRGILGANAAHARRGFDVNNPAEPK